MDGVQVKHQPNILLIVAHDLGTHLGCYGVPGVPSPRLDGLASEGARFTNYHATAVFCSPSRGALLTGKLPHVNGLMGLVNLGWDLSPDNVTLDQALGLAGYDTFLFGLQHEVKDDTRLSTMFDHVSDRSVSHRCDLVAPMVETFLRDRSDTETPFYARIGFSEVHRTYDHYTPEPESDVVLPPYLADTPGARDDFARFNGAIRSLDSAVGGILDALDASGLSDDTLVVFTVDHGIAFPRAKGTLYDSGSRTALLMRWPGGFKGGRVYDKLMSNVDLYPTVLEFAGAPVPEDLSGRSFSPLLKERDYAPNDRIFTEKSTSADDVKRGVRTEQYKYIRNYHEGPILRLPTDIELSTTRRDMGDDHLSPRPKTELYDLTSDPHEMRNLSGDPEHREIEESLATELQRHLEDTDDPVAFKEIERPPEEAGKIEEAWNRVHERLKARRDVR